MDSILLLGSSYGVLGGGYVVKLSFPGWLCHLQVVARVFSVVAMMFLGHSEQFIFLSMFKVF